MLLPKAKTPPKASLNDFTILLYGEPKVGKTTFCNAGGQTLFIATEDGQGGLESYRVPVDNWETFLQVLEELKQGGQPYDKVCIDTVDNLYKFCAEWACQKLGVIHQSDAAYGKGADTINSEFLRQLTRLSLMPYGLWMISHATEKEIKPRAGASYTMISPTLPAAARRIVLGMSDHILYAAREFETDEKTGAVIREQRVVHTQGSNYFEAGGRITLPETLPLDYAAFEKAFKAALKPLICEECGQQLQDTAKMRACDMAAWTMGRYGRQLCMKCAKKEHEKKEGEEE